MLTRFEILQIKAFEEHEVASIFEGASAAIRKQTACDDGISAMHLRVSAQRMIDHFTDCIDSYVAARLSDIVAAMTD